MVSRHSEHMRTPHSSATRRCQRSSCGKAKVVLVWCLECATSPFQARRSEPCTTKSHLLRPSARQVWLFSPSPFCLGHGGAAPRLHPISDAYASVLCASTSWRWAASPRSSCRLDGHSRMLLKCKEGSPGSPGAICCHQNSFENGSVLSCLRL